MRRRQGRDASAGGGGCVCGCEEEGKGPYPPAVRGGSERFTCENKVQSYKDEMERTRVCVR